jgi:hypothetical protein
LFIGLPFVGNWAGGAHRRTQYRARSMHIPAGPAFAVKNKCPSSLGKA